MCSISCSKYRIIPLPCAERYHDWHSKRFLYSLAHGLAISLFYVVDRAIEQPVQSCCWAFGAPVKRSAPRCSLWVKSRHSGKGRIRSAFGGKADSLAHLSACLLVAKLRRHGIRLLCKGVTKRVSTGHRLFFSDEVTAIQA